MLDPVYPVGDLPNCNWEISGGKGGYNKNDEVEGEVTEKSVRMNDHNSGKVKFTLL